MMYHFIIIHKGYSVSLCKAWTTAIILEIDTYVIYRYSNLELLHVVSSLSTYFLMLCLCLHNQTPKQIPCMWKLTWQYTWILIIGNLKSTELLDLQRESQQMCQRIWEDLKMEKCSSVKFEGVWNMYFSLGLPRCTHRTGLISWRH